jgi:hypothetical protein
MKNLSLPQRQLLSEIIAQPKRISPHYAPAIELVGSGYAEWTEPDQEGIAMLRATSAGKAALAAQHPE